MDIEIFAAPYDHGDARNKYISDEQLHAKGDGDHDALTIGIDPVRLSFNIQRVSVSIQVKSLTITASYPVNINFIFANAGTINVTAERRMFVAN